MSSSKMDLFQEKIQEVFLPIADKLNSQRHLAALKNGMTCTIPLTIIGGFFMLLAQPPVNPATLQPTNFFFKFLLDWKAWSTTYAQVLSVPYNLTIGLLAVYITFSIAYQLGKHYKLNGISCGVSALFLFLMTSAEPFTTADNGLIMSMKNLGAEGMFYGIIVAILSVEIFKWMSQHNIKLKMPAQVPPNVAAPFEALFPLIILTALFFVGNLVCINFTGSNLCRLIFTLLYPLMRATSSLPSVMLCSILLSLFWFMGIHGNNIVGSVLGPITTANIALNASAIMNGSGPTTPLAGSFTTLFGNWMSYPAMMVCFFLVARSAQLKSLRKIALVPDIFNINEPLTFGIPVVMNILIALPLMICNLVMCSIAYIVMDAGIVGSIYINVPWTTPGIINLFLSTMDFKAVIMWVIMFAVDILILLPFVKAYDKQMLAQENASSN